MWARQSTGLNYVTLKVINRNWHGRSSFIDQNVIQEKEHMLAVGKTLFWMLHIR